VVQIAPSASFKDAVECMLTAGLSGLPVVGTDNTLVGIVTEADLVSKEAYPRARRRRLLSVLAAYLRDDDPRWLRKAAGFTVADVMTTKPRTVSPDDDVITAARVMLATGHKQLPVVLAGKVVGIVSRRDMLRGFARSDDDIEREARAVLASPRWMPEDHEVKATVRKGVVRLTGTVRFPEDRAPVVAAMWSVAGVVGVDENVAAREESPILTDWHAPMG
jgi:CBS domain-containing protein